MNDLISRQAVIDVLIPILNEADNMYLVGRIIGAVDCIPVAYDVEKVIKELSCDDCETCVLQDFCNGNFGGEFMGKIREIIIRGGIDDAERD